MTKLLKICLLSIATLLLTLKGFTLFAPHLFEQPGLWLVFSVMALLGLFFIVVSQEEPRKKVSYEEWVSPPGRDGNMQNGDLSRE